MYTLLTFVWNARHVWGTKYGYTLNTHYIWIVYMYYNEDTHYTHYMEIHTTLHRATHYTHYLEIHTTLHGELHVCTHTAHIQCTLWCRLLHFFLVLHQNSENHTRRLQLARGWLVFYVWWWVGRRGAGAWPSMRSINRTSSDNYKNECVQQCTNVPMCMYA